MRVNGTEMILHKNVSLKEFLEEHMYDIGRVAVEKNGNIISKGAFATEILSDKDRIEIVSFVGGG